MYKIYLTALALLGAIFIFFAVYFNNLNREFRIYGMETEAVITRIETLGSDDNINQVVHIEYEINGYIYQNTLGVYSSSMYVGQILLIRVMPDNHLRIHYARFENVLPAVFIFFGVFFIGGAVLQIILRGIANNNRRKRFSDKHGKK
ncbi:MAG: hypothetical protein FWE36_03385 [Erysipelotrichales bacterium]|nr:hypothetical protein [Erysipelotrichales bacterium]